MPLPNRPCKNTNPPPTAPLLSRRHSRNTLLLSRSRSSTLLLRAARARARADTRAPRKPRRRQMGLRAALQVGQHALQLADAQLEHLVFAGEHEGLGLVEGGVVAGGCGGRGR